MPKAKTPVYFTCEKCGTENSEVFEYNDRWLCKANACYQEETEHDSNIQEEREQNLDDYKRLCAGTNTGG